MAITKVSSLVIVNLGDVASFQARQVRSHFGSTQGNMAEKRKSKKRGKDTTAGKPPLLTDSRWKQLVQGIKERRLTPFLGAGISYGLLPLGREIAQEWAHEHNYPMEDDGDLIAVSQFLAVQEFSMFPKDEIVAMFGKIAVTPRFDEANQPHRVLADLPLTTYITTNYDDFMEQALKSRFREPKAEICRWNSQVRNRPSLFDGRFNPTVAGPVVFHLHGQLEDSYSLVLTEDDYVDFMVNTSRDGGIIPPLIQTSLTQTSLLFIGYRLADWNFRVLLRSLHRFMEEGVKRRHLAVMLPPSVPKANQQRACKYWEKYYDRMDIDVCWTTAGDFLTELRKKWSASQ